MEINWTLVVSNAIGGSITGVIVGAVLLILNRTVKEWVSKIMGRTNNKDKT